MIPGFFFHETMRGSYHMLDAPTVEGAIAFTVKVSAKDVRRFVKDKTWTIRGEVDVEGIAARRPLEGTIGFRLLDERRMPYRFTFTADDGTPYELRGQKEWTALAPVESMTLLPASLYDAAGKEIGRATLRFDARNELGKFLKSFRLAF